MYRKVKLISVLNIIFLLLLLLVISLSYSTFLQKPVNSTVTAEDIQNEFHSPSDFMKLQ